MIQVPNEEPDEFLKMPSGLEGYWWETKRVICVPIVINCNPGDGSFSEFLTQLIEKEKLVFFPTIISARLEAILRKRGFQEAFVVDDLMGFVDGLALAP